MASRPPPRPPHTTRPRCTRIRDLEEHPLSRVARQLTQHRPHHHCLLLQGARNLRVRTGAPTRTDDPRTRPRATIPRAPRMLHSRLPRDTILATAPSAATGMPPCLATPFHPRPRSLHMARRNGPTRYHRDRYPHHHPTSPTATNTSHRRTGAIKTNCSTTL